MKRGYLAHRFLISYTISVQIIFTEVPLLVFKFALIVGAELGER